MNLQISRMFILFLNQIKKIQLNKRDERCSSGCYIWRVENFSLLCRFEREKLCSDEFRRYNGKKTRDCCDFYFISFQLHITHFSFAFKSKLRTSFFFSFTTSTLNVVEEKLKINFFCFCFSSLYKIGKKRRRSREDEDVFFFESFFFLFLFAGY